MQIETKFDMGDEVWVIVSALKCKIIKLGVIKEIDINANVVPNPEPMFLQIGYHFNTDVGGAFRNEEEFMDNFFPHTTEGKQQAEARVKELNNE